MSTSSRQSCSAISPLCLSKTIARALSSQNIELTEGRHAHILNPEAQVSGVFLVMVLLLQLSGAALQQGQHLGLVPSSLEGGLGPLDVPGLTNLCAAAAHNSQRFSFLARTAKALFKSLLSAVVPIVPGGVYHFYLFAHLSQGSRGSSPSYSAISWQNCLQQS